jgi:dihydroorotate dehydrogenase
MDLYKQILRPVLFWLDPESAHNMAKALLKRPILGRLFGGQGPLVRSDRLQVRLGGLTVPNPVGLAAGFDKDCDMLNSLAHFGFGYLVAGSVMKDAQPGNPKPRMVRDPEREGLYSCMGLPSLGLEYAVKQLRGRQGLVPLIMNFNALGLEDYLKCFEVLQPLGDALEIALFCPNRTHDAGDFLSPSIAKTLLTEITKRKKKPVFIKFSVYGSEGDGRKHFELIKTILDYPVDGITISPGRRVEEQRLAIGRGTLTGRINLPRILDILEEIYSFTKGECHIKASGGIFTPRDAFNAIAAGASTVEIHTGLIYEGWAIAKNINQGLLDLLEKHNIENIETLRGTGIKS